jgi:ribosomal protein S18 acetylase RimI-like enzyme
MDVVIKPLSPELLDDYLFFFDNIVFTENPDWSKCYCFSFHFVGSDEEWKKESNRRSVAEYIKANKMAGYLAYLDDIPVGWCNANNRLNYQRLLKYYDLIDNPDDKVCSVVCFLVHPDHRRKGIAKNLLAQICRDYAKRGYDFIEAYPGKGLLSCERHYKGPLELYQKFDFMIKKELEHFYIVRKQLK